MNEERCCLACGDKLRGRADKKFCNDYCRNNYNNQQRARVGNSPVVKYVNSCLQRNRKIMESVLTEGGGATKIRRHKLLCLGFHFGYFTHVNGDEPGRVCNCCYDYGYLVIDDDWCLIIKLEDQWL